MQRLFLRCSSARVRGRRDRMSARLFGPLRSTLLRSRQVHRLDTGDSLRPSRVRCLLDAVRTRSLTSNVAGPEPNHSGPVAALLKSWKSERSLEDPTMVSRKSALRSGFAWFAGWTACSAILSVVLDGELFGFYLFVGVVSGILFGTLQYFLARAMSTQLGVRQRIEQKLRRQR